ncbi:MAG: ATP-binding protein [Acidobacteriota bacterium]
MITATHPGTAQARPTVNVGREPQTLQEAGLSIDLVSQLILKTLHFSGEISGGLLASRLGLSHTAIEPLLQHLKFTHLCEVTGGGVLGGPSFVYRISDAGRARALLYLEQSHYVGVAPVPFSHYEDYMRNFARSMPRTATRPRVKEAFGHLVLSDRVLDQLGPAVNGAHSLFVYGPPGNGKTVIAQAIRNLLDGIIAVPHAIEAEGQIIQLFDPIVHEPIARFVDENAIDLGEGADQRWVYCRRPLVTVGGELTTDSLELSFSPTAKFYKPAVQLTANGGVLVIDDFGRQKCSPVDLLNRWITPLESRVDYLTLQTGQKLPVPFVVLVVFATNLKPTDLVDEAFLRRIHYKVFAENPTLDDFKQIFERCCHERDLPFEGSLVDHLLATYYEPRTLLPRGCHPRDLIDQALSLADYRGEPRRLTDELLEAACTSYFVDDPTN